MIFGTAERLRAECPILTSVEMAEELDALSKGTTPRHGTAFVVPYRERATPNALATGFRQHVAVQILVAFVVRRHDDSKGGKRAALFDDIKREIETALAGWEPDFVDDPFELVAGQSAPLGNGASIYVQTWETSRTLEGQ